jgi:hypothetical protein
MPPPFALMLPSLVLFFPPKKRNENQIEKQRQAQENMLAEEEELNQPVNFEKYKLEYNNIKVKTFSQAMIRAKIPMSYGGKHAVCWIFVFL